MTYLFDNAGLSSRSSLVSTPTVCAWFIGQMETWMWTRPLMRGPPDRRTSTSSRIFPTYCDNSNSPSPRNTFCRPTCEYRPIDDLFSWYTAG